MTASACSLFVLATLNASLWHFPTKKKKNRRGRKKTTTITAYIANPPPFPLPHPQSFSQPPTRLPSSPCLFSFFLPLPLLYLSCSVWMPNIVLFMPPTGSPPSLAQRLLSPLWTRLFGSSLQCMRCAQTQEPPRRQSHPPIRPQLPPPLTHS